MSIPAHWNGAGNADYQLRYYMVKLLELVDLSLYLSGNVL